MNETVNRYYGELCTKVYEQDKSLAEGKELEFYLSFAGSTNMRVLEPMCGNGRLLIPFMQHGVDIEGFDISEEMLRVCREKGLERNLHPRVYHCPIERFASPGVFDLIVIPFGSFSLLPDELVDVSLVHLREALAPQGKLLLTIMVKPDEVKEIPEWAEAGKVQLEKEAIRMYKRVQYDRTQALMLTELKYELVRDEQVVQTEIMDFPVKLYDMGEFKGVLERNGFDRIHLHEVKDGYGEGAHLFVFECCLFE